MRVLFTIIPARGHLYPIVPLARALEVAGHEVRVASHRGVAGFWDMREMITAQALTAVSLGEDLDVAATEGRVPDDRLNAAIDELAAAGADPVLVNTARDFVQSALWAYYPVTPPSSGRPTVDDLVEVTRSWRPDLVLWDPLFLAAPVAARDCGAAHARFLSTRDYVGWLRAALRTADRPANDPIAALMIPALRRFGQDFGEDLLLGQWTIDPMVPELRLPAATRTVAVRQVPYGGAAAVPDWLSEPVTRRRVCVSMGVTPREDLISRAVPLAELFEAVADVDAEVVTTMSAEQLDTVGAVPGNVRPIGYLPLDLLLPGCDAIVHHGGAHTVAAAAAHEVPQLVDPQEGLDYAAMGQYVAVAGAGLALEPGSGRDVVRKSLGRVLDEPGFRAGAAELRARTLLVPAPADVVPLLVELTAGHRR
jgi:UDP:flavonoid glycosyltransferase YjiC (YdhE family)